MRIYYIGGSNRWASSIINYSNTDMSTIADYENYTKVSLVVLRSSQMEERKH